MNRRRDPVTARLWSLRAPITGSMSTSHTFATVTSTPAQIAATPSVSVRKNTSTRPGSVAKPPVPIEPAA